MKHIPYTKLNDEVIEQVKEGKRLILTATDGTPSATLVPLDDLEIVQDYHDAEERIDQQAVQEARQEDDLIEWDD